MSCGRAGPRDDLDRRLLDHFAGRFSRPATLEYCEYDVSADEVARICGGRTLLEEGLVERFVSHNRLGFVGDYWTAFPPFAGNVAAFCRRGSLTLEHDLAFFFLHLGPHGAFDGSDVALLGEWVEDLLRPWERPIERGERLWWTEHALDYLALHARLGGDPAAAVRANLERQEQPTALVSALSDFIDRGGCLDEARAGAHLEGFGRSVANQMLPTDELVTATEIALVLAALRQL